jgi:putative membrane protein
MTIKFLDPAAFTGALLALIVGAVPVAAQGSAPQVGLASDSIFIQTAGSLGLLQAKLGSLAQKKATSPAVRDYGKRMADEYSKANQELAAGAKRAAYPAPLILRQHKQVLDQFLNTGGGSFDKKYMAEMVREQGQAAQLFKQEAESGRVASLKQLASSMLPMVQQHLSLATQTAESVGADITATTAPQRRTGS